MNQEAKEIIQAFQNENETLKRELETLRCNRNDQQQKIDQLEEQLQSLLKKLYGKKSEKYQHPDQGDLLDLIDGFNPEENEDSLETSPSSYQNLTYQRKTPKPKGPKPLPENLPREVIYIDPPEADRNCACCHLPLVVVKEVITEELVYIPAKFVVKQFIQRHYACKEHMNRPLVAPLPYRPIPKGRPSASLLAFILISKYCDALPLYRIEKIFKRLGVDITRSTMNSWLGPLSDLLLPLVESLKRKLLEESFLQMDETPISALDPKVKKGSKQCYVWALGHPKGEVYYFVTESRAAKHPLKILEGFRGHLQSDGYSAYKTVSSEIEDITSIACMAHIRRKFFEAEHSHPERVTEILLLIQELYKIEAEAKEKGLTCDERRDLRQAKAKSTFKYLKSKIDALAPIPTPGSKLGKAVTYALNQWESMERYLEVGEAEIDNNSTERDIKSVVIGRKNYLFLGRAKAGGQRVEAFYTLIESAKRFGLEPFHYLQEVIERIPSTPREKLDELLPSNFKTLQSTTENVTG